MVGLSWRFHQKQHPPPQGDINGISSNNTNVRMSVHFTGQAYIDFIYIAYPRNLGKPHCTPDIIVYLQWAWPPSSRQSSNWALPTKGRKCCSWPAVTQVSCGYHCHTWFEWKRVHYVDQQAKPAMAGQTPATFSSRSKSVYLWLQCYNFQLLKSRYWRFCAQIINTLKYSSTVRGGIAASSQNISLIC